LADAIIYDEIFQVSFDFRKRHRRQPDHNNLEWLHSGRFEIVSPLNWRDFDVDLGVLDISLVILHMIGLVAAWGYHC
jgi:hypothetical protein